MTIRIKIGYGRPHKGSSMFDRLSVVALLLLALAWSAALSQAQQPAAPAAAEDAAARTKILEGERWRRAMFEINEWLANQSLYPPEEVEQMGIQFQQRVAGMNAAELAQLLADWETKLQIMDNPQVREARAWMAEYVSVLSDRKRAEVLKDLPNLSTLTAAQLHQEVMRIKQKRSSLEGRQSAFRQNQGARVSQQLAANQASQQARARQSAPRASSPYRPATPSTNHNANLTPKPRPKFWVDAMGGVARPLPANGFGRTMPNSW